MVIKPQKKTIAKLFLILLKLHNSIRNFFTTDLIQSNCVAVQKSFRGLVPLIIASKNDVIAIRYNYIAIVLLGIANEYFHIAFMSLGIAFASLGVALSSVCIALLYIVVALVPLGIAC